MTASSAPIRPDRVRRIDGSFTFIPSRFLHHGFLATIDHREAALYLFLLLASNRHGVSHYHYDRIYKTLNMDGDTYVRARDGLIAKDLIAFDGSRYQVLTLPRRPVSGAHQHPVSGAPQHHVSEAHQRLRRNAVAPAPDAPLDRTGSLQCIREILANLAQ